MIGWIHLKSSFKYQKLRSFCVTLMSKRTSQSSLTEFEPQTKKHKLNMDIKSNNLKVEKSQMEMKLENNLKNKLEKSKPPKKGSRLEFDLSNSPYIFHNNLRYVKPYHYSYKSYAKGRWFNKQIYNVFTSEFVTYDSNYYKNAILNGKILVRNKKVSLDYIIKNGDWITHRVHRHEPPVNGIQNINIIYENDDYIVIDKPSSIPVHPSGKYRYNSIVAILKHQLLLLDKNKYSNITLSSAHRLDRVTSGLLIICKNSKIASLLGEIIRNKQVKKTYLALVYGKFPYQNISVNEAINVKDERNGIHCIDNINGKQSMTKFELLKYNNNKNISLIKCYPLTGRTHQIRLHLAHLKYPIINDILYNGKECINIDIKYNNPYLDNNKTNILTNNLINKNYQNDCNECKLWKNKLLENRHKNWTQLNPLLTNPNEKKGIIQSCIHEICLHALEYECDEWKYTTKQPYWADLEKVNFSWKN